MNAHDRNLPVQDLAVLHYGDGEFAVLKPGRFVLCAVSGAKIPLEALRYWSPAHQEAYAGPDEALTRWVERHPIAPGRIYLDIGTLEGRRNRRRKTPPKSPSGAMRRLRKLRRILEEKGFVLGDDLAWSEERGGRHDEAAWSRRLPGMLQFLFPT